MKKIVVLFSLLAVCVLYISRCTTVTDKEEEAIMEKHCQSCHQLPEPSLLDKKTWANFVLPKMGDLLGFRYFGEGTYFEDDRKSQAMPLTDWEKLVRYILANAPDSLATEQKKIALEATPFQVSTPSFSLGNPATTFVRILPDRRFLFGDGFAEKLYLLQNQTMQDSFPAGRGVVHVQVKDSELLCLSMGVLHPSDERSGKLLVHHLETGQNSIILDSLQRPVYADYADLNNDLLDDIVLCEFGNSMGQLSWFQQTGSGRYLKHILRGLPGAVRTKITDVNRDGRPDIIALMAQGDEGVFLYVNKGSGIFEEKRLLRFPPSYGSNYFDLVDFNGDGNLDIITTNGDNGDYPPVLKPYHGIRLFLNDGAFHFTEKRFLPMNGVGKAIMLDYDEDGDLDIAAISYFPDYVHSPEEGFIYWENTGQLQFQPKSFKESVSGRWLTMDAGDIDADGDTDLILGNTKFSLGAVPDSIIRGWERQPVSVLILTNRLK
jgi:hypothetical protein